MDFATKQLFVVFSHKYMGYLKLLISEKTSKKTLELAIYKDEVFTENTLIKSNSSFLTHWFFGVPLTKEVPALQPEV